MCGKEVSYKEDVKDSDRKKLFAIIDDLLQPLLCALSFKGYIEFVRVVVVNLRKKVYDLSDGIVIITYLFLIQCFLDKKTAYRVGQNLLDK